MGDWKGAAEGGGFSRPVRNARDGWGEGGAGLDSPWLLERGKTRRRRPEGCRNRFSKPDSLFIMNPRRILTKLNSRPGHKAADWDRTRNNLISRSEKSIGRTAAQLTHVYCKGRV